MRIEIQRNETSRPIVYEDVVNAYTKGSMYCVLFISNADDRFGQRVTHKYPLCSIFRVSEDYERTKR